MKENCKHGMNPKWCAYCLGKVRKVHQEGVGRGSLRIFGLESYTASWSWEHIHGNTQYRKYLTFKSASQESFEEYLMEISR